MSQSNLREEDLIAALGAVLDAPRGRVLLGIGDDAAIWQPSRSHRAVITTDALVDGVHFHARAMAPQAIGVRAMVANLSDLAAMGARPLLATVALGVPAEFSQGHLVDIYRGMNAVAREVQLSIVGGDITRAPVLSLTITAVGEVRPSHVKLRSGARVGDMLAVTGPLGAARAGWMLAAHPDALEEALAAQAREAYEYPRARVREGAWLAASAHVHAMMDCSDGLSTDVHRLCAAGRLGAVLTDLPISPSAEAFARVIGEDPQDFVLAGGEEYELIVAVSARGFSHLARRFRTHFRRPLLPVGRLRAELGILCRSALGDRIVEPSGWDHMLR